MEKSKKPAGWWSLPDLSGSVAGVMRSIEEAPDVPRYWKEAIKADITERCEAEFNFVYLDASFVVEKGNAVLNYHCIPDKKFL